MEGADEDDEACLSGSSSSSAGTRESGPPMLFCTCVFVGSWWLVSVIGQTFWHAYANPFLIFEGSRC